MNKTQLLATHLPTAYTPEWVLSEYVDHDYGVKEISRSICVDDELINVYVNSQRYLLFAQDGLKCSKCQAEATVCFLSKPSQNRSHFNFFCEKNGEYVLLTKDHKVARANGGRDVLANYIPMCSRCNVKKGSRNTQSEIENGIESGVVDSINTNVTVSRNLMNSKPSIESIVLFCKVMDANIEVDEKNCILRISPRKAVKFTIKSIKKIIDIHQNAINVK